MNTLLIAIILVGFAIICFGVDLFIPTGGILMIFAAVAALLGLGFGFAHSAMTGGWLTVVILIAIPITLMIFVKVYPNTALGKQMFIGRPQAIPYEYSRDTKGHALKIGDVGLATTDLHPSGKISVNDIHFEAVSVTGIITNGSPIIVTDIEMDVATVERYEAPIEIDSLNESKNNDQKRLSIKENSKLLEMPVDEFNLNDFDSPKDG